MRVKSVNTPLPSLHIAGCCSLKRQGRSRGSSLVSGSPPVVGELSFETISSRRKHDLRAKVAGAFLRPCNQCTGPRWDTSRVQCAHRRFVSGVSCISVHTYLATPCRPSYIIYKLTSEINVDWLEYALSIQLEINILTLVGIYVHT